MAGETKTEIIITDLGLIAAMGGKSNLGNIIDESSETNFEDLGQQPDDVNSGGSVLDVSGNIATKLNSIAGSRIRTLMLDFIMSTGAGMGAHDYLMGKSGFKAVNRPLSFAGSVSGAGLSGLMSITRKINNIPYTYIFSNIVVKKFDTTIFQRGGEGSEGKKFTVTFEVVLAL